MSLILIPIARKFSYRVGCALKPEYMKFTIKEAVDARVVRVVGNKAQRLLQVTVEWSDLLQGR